MLGLGKSKVTVIDTSNGQKFLPLEAQDISKIKEESYSTIVKELNTD